jgi:hypothetical protein
VVADSVAGNARSYGPRPSPLLSFPDDSAYFIDVVSRTLVLFGTTGEPLRVAALPRPQDLSFLTSYPSSIDRNGRLIYRTNAFAPDLVGGREVSMATAPSADSAPLIRVDFDARVLDTVAAIRVAGLVLASTVVNAAGEKTTRLKVRPYTWIDDWTVQPDGTIAILRGQDYHVDLVRPDGSVLIGPKLPFDWRRVTDDEKRALTDRVLDSLRAAEAEHAKTGMRRRSTANLATGEITDLGPAPPKEFESVALSEMPDYYPPVKVGAIRADYDGQVWILPSTSAQSSGGLVYDVVGPNGAMRERVELPAGYSIVGFGKNGRLYITRKASSGWVLARASVIR